MKFHLILGYFVRGGKGWFPFKLGCLLFSLFIQLGHILPAHASFIRLNEIMPNPSGKDQAGEFIELYNPTDSPVDLTGWQLDDKINAGSSPYLLNGIILASHSYIVFFYQETKIQLNNRADEVNLINPLGNIVQTVDYSSAREGKSFAFTQGRGWQWSEYPTPGEYNASPPSIQKFEINPIAVNLTISQEISFSIQASDPDNDIVVQMITLPAPLNKKIFSNHWFYRANQLNQPIEMKVSLTVKDGRGLTAIKTAQLVFYQPGQGIKISEIYPAPSKNKEEYIELYNPFPFSVDVHFFQLDDAPGGSRPFQINSEAIIPSHGYRLFSQQLTGVRLNNSGDAVRLIDPTGKVIDFVEYRHAQPGQAFIRIGQNWFWSEKLTPGAPPPLRQTHQFDLLISEVVPNPSGSDAVNEFVEIFNSGKQAFDLVGWRLDDNLSGGSQAYIFPHKIIQPGEYLALFQSETNIQLNNQGDEVNLISPNGRIVSSLSYTTAQEEESYSLWRGRFIWTNQLTPGSLNQPNLFSINQTDKAEENKPEKKQAEFILPTPPQPILSLGSLATSFQNKTVQLKSPLQLFCANFSRRLAKMFFSPTPALAKDFPTFNGLVLGVVNERQLNKNFKNSHFWAIIKGLLLLNLIFSFQSLWKVIQSKPGRIQKE